MTTSYEVLTPDNWITHVPDPGRLILAWQAPDHMGDRNRWAVGELRRAAVGTFEFRYFHHEDDFARYNPGRTSAVLRSLGYQGYPAFRDGPRAVVGEQAIVPFLRRIPPRRRSDYQAYREYYRLPPEVNISDFALLGVTEAKLPSDGFSLVDTFEDRAGRREILLEVAGYRHHAKALARAPLIGEVARFVPEPSNPHDPNAVSIHVAGGLLGYVNRLQTSAFQSWIAAGRVEGVVEQINGSDTRPRVFVFVRVR